MYSIYAGPLSRLEVGGWAMFPSTGPNMYSIGHTHIGCVTHTHTLFNASTGVFNAPSSHHGKKKKERKSQQLGPGGILRRGIYMYE